MIIKLTKKIFYEDTEYEELNFNLEGLKCFDLFQVEDLGRSLDKENFQLWGTRHIILLAARAAGVPFTLIYELSAKDFMKIQLAIINFFSDIISSASQEESSDAPF